MPNGPQTRTTVLNVVGTVGKVLSALLVVGLVAALAGKGTLGIVLLAVGAVGGAVGVVLDARVKALKARSDSLREARERDATAAELDRAIGSALRNAVCSVADVRLEAIGVDAVDPRVLDRAIGVEGDQLVYVHRDVDARLRQHLSRAQNGQGPALVCLYGPSKAGKSRSMLEAIKAEMPDALLVAPDRTRKNLQTIIDGGVLQHAADASNGGCVVLWLDDLEGFVRLGDGGLDRRGLATLKQELPSLVVAATAGVASQFPGEFARA
jgi:hypothetical protein